MGSDANRGLLRGPLPCRFHLRVLQVIVMLREDYKNTKDRVESPLDTSPVLSALLASAITTRTATAPSHTIYPTSKSAL